MSNSVQGTQSFSRGIDLLQEISDQPTPPTLRDLLDVSGLTRPTLYRLLSGLEAEGLIAVGDDRRYRLGLRLVHLARRALADSDVRRIARPVLEELRDRTGETVHLAVRNDNAMIYVDKIESTEMVRMASTIGTRVPIHSTGVGKAFLSALSEQECDAVVGTLSLDRVTQHTTTSKKKLKQQIEIARRQGYIQDHEENELGISCFGGAIVNERDEPVAAVSVSVPLFRLKDDPAFYAPALVDAVSRVSALLGAKVR